MKSGLFHQDGAPYNPERFKREMMENINAHATDHLEIVLNSLFCPEHHQRATLVRTATGWEVSCCCPAFEKKTQEALGCEPQ